MSDTNGTCARCGRPAYVGLNDIECMWCDTAKQQREALRRLEDVYSRGGWTAEELRQLREAREQVPCEGQRRAFQALMEQARLSRAMSKKEG